MKRSFVVAMFLALMTWSVQGAVQDLGTWTEIDPYGYLTVTDTSVVAATMPTNVTTAVAKDLGVAFDGDSDYTVLLEFTGGTCSHTTTANVLGVLGLSNITQDNPTWTGIFFTEGVAIRWTRDSNGHKLLLEMHNYPDHLYGSDPAALSASTKYYVRLDYDADGGDDSVGLYTMYVATGNHHGSGGSLIDTQTLSVPDGWTRSWTVASLAASRTNGSSSITQSGTIENVDISGEAAPPEPNEPPEKATNPSPAHQATGVSTTPTLTWGVAAGAINYNVYFGPTGSMVLIGNQTARSYSPAALDPNGASYSWRIDPNNAEGTTTGDVWTFKTVYVYSEGDYGETEDFNYWTLVNPQGELAVTDANTITVTNLSMDHSAYAYRFLGADYFSGNYTIRWQAHIDAVTNNGTLGLFAVADRPDSYMGWIWGSDDVQMVYVKSESGVLNCHLAIIDDGVIDSNSTQLTVGTDYWFQLERNDTGGDNSAGLLTLYITTGNYHGESGSVAVATVSMDVPAGEQNDYDYALTTITKSNHGTSAIISGAVEYIDLGAVISSPYDPPPKATILTPSDGATDVSTAITLAWNAVPNATNYNVYFGMPGSLSIDPNSFVGNQTIRSYTPTGLVSATTYAWRIDPNNAYGTTQGDQWTFTTGNTTSTTGSLSSVTQHGITWTFDKPYTVGQFANGDFYVIGPVTIISISPSGATQNGTMINPVSNTAQGFDSRSNHWDATTNIADDLPYTVPVGSSVISSRSLAEASSSSYVGYCAILTVLDSAPADGSFRPPYFGTDKTIKYNISQLNYNLLYNLTPTANAPTPMAAAEWFEGPWIDFGLGWGGRTFHPAGQMPPYGRDLSARIGSGALALHLNYTNQQKANLMIRFTQLGIDNFGIVSHPGGRTTWSPDGGHCMGRKFPILFAGAVLGDADMLGIGEKSGAYLWSAKPGGGFYGPGDPPPDLLFFQEDMQTFFIDQFMVDLELEVCVEGYALGSTSTTITVTGLPKWRGQPEDQYVEILSGPGAGQRRYVVSSDYQRTNNPDAPVVLTVSGAWTTIPTTSSYYKLQGYDSEDIGVPEWGNMHALMPTTSHPSWEADYRWINGVSYTGWVLAALIMNLEDQWNHEALFAYQDRWMNNTTRSSWEPWQDEMWAAYRNNLPSAPTTAPTVPTNPIPVNGAADISTTVTLQWDGQATSWTIYVGTSSDALVYQGDTTIRQYLLTLDYGTTYYWQVVAKNAYGSTLSPIWSFTTADEDLQAPGVPVIQNPVSGATNQPTSLTLQWSSTAATTHYEVHFGTVGNMTIVATPTSNRHNITGLANSTTYQWQINAVGPGGVTSSTIGTFTTVAAGGVPSDPTSPTLPASSPGVRVRGPYERSLRPDSNSQRYLTPYESLHVAELIQEPAMPGTYIIDPYLMGYLERIVINAVGEDTQWSLNISDAAGAILFAATDLDMTAGVVSYDGQRIPFSGGLKVTIADTTGADRLEIYCYVWEVFTR
ncbi:MAG TPA: hypothetical protein P5242_19150 [Sedimentisphaerales bacterium]|nr:hypothetical protein [Sedimentisphaerales bacterium]